MFLNTRKFLLGFVLSLMLLPMMSFASTEFKGTETVNINKANAATLAAYLKGIGANKAEAIVKYRKSNGSFKTAADIKNVPGVGDETFKDIKSKISTSRGKSTAPKGYKLGETSGKSTSTKKKSTAKKSSTSKSKSTAKKSSTSKSTTAKAKKDTKAKKTSTAKKSSTAKKTTAKKTKAKKTVAKKTKTTKKPASTKKKTTKKKPAKKKTTKKKTTKKKSS